MFKIDLWTFFVGILEFYLRNTYIVDIIQHFSFTELYLYVWNLTSL